MGCLNERTIEFIVENIQFGNLIRFAKYYNLASQIIWFMVRKQTYVIDDDEIWL